MSLEVKSILHKYDEIKEYVQIVESTVAEMPQIGSEQERKEGYSGVTKRIDKNEDFAGHSLNATKNAGHLFQRKPVVPLGRLDLEAVNELSTASLKVKSERRKLAVASTDRKHRHQLSRRFNLALAESVSRDRDAGLPLRKRRLSTECSTNLKLSRSGTPVCKQPRQEDAEATTVQRTKSWHFKQPALKEPVPGPSRLRMNERGSSSAWTPKLLPVIETGNDTISNGSGGPPGSGKVQDVCNELITLSIHGYVNDVD